MAKTRTMVVLMLAFAATLGVLGRAPEVEHERPAAVRGFFPDYDDPVTAEAPLPHPSARPPCVTLDVMVGVRVASWGPAAHRPYTPPSGDCRGPWEQVVLELSGAVAGVQFDRYGAVWLRGVELLRLTGPEPSPAGIHWEVAKDVSDYAEVFLSSGELALLLPNVVNREYTGVFDLNISVAFYGPQQSRTPPTIIPLRNATSFAEVTGAGLPHHVTLPNDVIEARLDVFASAHACEEFWYSNSMASEKGNCAGGAFRELDVFVDGRLAGAQYPFPVLYTGGANPLLWRPLTGILSFNIPAYHFDLTPFLGWLTDGQEHNITLAAIHNWQGTWILNGVLVLQRDSAPVQGGSVEPEEEPLVVLEELRGEGSADSLAGMVQTMNSTHSYSVRGSLTLACGRVQQSDAMGQLSAWSSNSGIGEDMLVTTARWHSSISTSRDGRWKTTVADFPFFLSDGGKEDAASLQLNTSVDYARQVAISFGSGPLVSSRQALPEYGVTLRNAESGSALYNRSKEHRLNLEEAYSRETFQVWTSSAAESTPCYSRVLQAQNGSIASDQMQDACEWLRGVYLCGSDLCGSLGEKSGSRFAPGSHSEVQARGHHRERQVVGGREAAALPLRSSRLGLAALMRGVLSEAFPPAPADEAKTMPVATVVLATAEGLQQKGPSDEAATSSTAAAAVAALCAVFALVLGAGAARRLPCHLAAAGAVPLLEEGLQ